MSLLTIPKAPDRQQWLRDRHGYFNASDVPVLYDCHPFRELADVVADKLAPEPTDNGQTEAMERGVRLEPVLLDWFGDRHGATVITPDVLYANGRLLATLDGELVGADDEWVEAKTTSDRWDSVPPHVYWQVVAQAAASGKHRCHVVWFDADLRLKHEVVVPHAEHVADVLERAERFMAYVDLGLAPEGVVLRYEHVVRLHPAPEMGRWADLDDDGLTAVVRWEQARQERLAAEKAEREAKDAVANLLMDAEGARYGGQPVLTWRANKPTARVDWKAAALDMAETVGAAPEQVEEQYAVTASGARVMRAGKVLAQFIASHIDDEETF